MSFNFMATITICSDFWAPKNKVCHCFHCFQVMGPDAMILVFWMLSFKPTFSLSSFTFIKRLFSSLSAKSVELFAYLRLLIFLPTILILIFDTYFNCVHFIFLDTLVSHSKVPKSKQQCEKEAQPQFSSVQLLSCVWFFVTPWTAACQASLFLTNSWSFLRLTSFKSVKPSNYLILCHPLLLPSIFPSIRVFSNESALHIRGPKFWSFSFSISPSNEYSGLISFRKLKLILITFNFPLSPGKLSLSITWLIKVLHSKFLVFLKT